MTVKIPILILFCFCLLKIHLFCIVSLLQLQTVLIIQALGDGFRSLQDVLDRFRSFQFIPQTVLACFRWFQLVLDGFRPFQIVLGRFSSFLILASTQDFSQSYGFNRIINVTMVHDLNPKNLHITGLFFLQNPKSPFLGGAFGRYPQIEIFSQKSGSVRFLLLRHSNFIRYFRKIRFGEHTFTY